MEYLCIQGIAWPGCILPGHACLSSGGRFLQMGIAGDKATELVRPGLIALRVRLRHAGWQGCNHRVEIGIDEEGDRRALSPRGVDHPLHVGKVEALLQTSPTARIHVANIVGWFDKDMVRCPPVFTDAAIQFCLVVKVLFGQPLRQTTGMVSSILSMAGRDWPVPDFSTPSRRQKTIEVQISMHRDQVPW